MRYPQKAPQSMIKYINEVRNVYGKLTVVSVAEPKNGARFVCECSCGNVVTIHGRRLRSEKPKSCICGRKAQAIKNCMTGIQKKKVNSPHARRLKDLRRNMIARCYDSKNKRYDCYGARGIVVCDEWVRDIRGFYKWCLDNGYAPGLQLNRINNNGNYEPSNCNFVTALENANNTRHNHMVRWGGKEKSISDWARQMGVRPQALIHRFTRGWDLQRAMTQPFRDWPNAKQ